MLLLITGGLSVSGLVILLHAWSCPGLSHSLNRSTFRQDLVQQLRLAEMIITRAQSLHTKFSAEQPGGATGDLRTFVSSLLDQPEVDVVGASRGPIGRVIQGLFITAEKVSGSTGRQNMNELRSTSAT